MLARHGLNARDYLLGALTLYSAATQELLQQYPEMASEDRASPGYTVSDANMTIYRRHQADLQRQTRALGEQASRKSGGSVPPCMEWTAPGQAEICRTTSDPSRAHPRIAS